MQFNQIQFAGRLVKDPEYKEIGTGLAKFSVAVNKSFKNKDGSWGNKTVYMNDVDLWGKYAKDTADRFNKGQEVFVTGEFDENEWEQDGQKRKKLIVKASKIMSCGSNGSTSKDSNDEPDF